MSRIAAILASSMLLGSTLASAQAPGAAGPRSPYWQQGVAYDITARLDEGAGVLSGTEQIRYVNRSPDTLTTFSLHLYLNAFRPGSRWADADSVEGRRRFNDLTDPDFAYNHVRGVRIMGQAVTATYPFAPDSTIVRFELPHPLLPGDSLTAEMGWDARPSTVPRRQGRQGRRFDFAQWYPKVVVYDRYGWEEHPLFPAGEFYGEFATFRVRLDLPEDEVMGATGVPVCGDPGWERANRQPGRPIEYQRDRYGERGRAAAAGGCEGADAGRKRLVWYAEDVHHFAMSLNPAYRCEGGHFGDVAVHVLYQPGDSITWGGGVAVKRTETALAWLDRIYGPFAWPQITNVHRIEGGGTEFPMMIHDGSADQGLIVHELGHNYTMGILANNEWKEGWLDEGFTSFQTGWFFEATAGRDAYPGNERQMLELELDGYAEPASLVSDKYRDFVSYNIAIYSRGQFFFQQLRYLVGDETMVRILRTFYDRWKLKHVDEDAFREVAEAVSQRDLKTFFAQWLHTTDMVDYRVGRVKRARRGGGWVTAVEVVRNEAGRIPVDVMVRAEGDSGIVRADGLAERAWVEVPTRTKPKEVVLDPRAQTHDWNMLNNGRRRIGKFLGGNRFSGQRTHFYLDTYVSTPQYRDRPTSGSMPTAWYNDAGGLTLGLRNRHDYLGRFEQNVLLASYSTGWGEDNGVHDVDVFARLRNPVWLRWPNVSQTVEGFNVEGRYGARIALERKRRDHLTFGPERRASAQLQWVATDDGRYLDPGYYENVGTVDLALSNGIATRSGRWQLGAEAAIAGGLAYARNGLEFATGRLNVDPFYGRVSVEGTARRPLGKRFGLAGRLFAAGAIADHEAVKQRQIYLAGADPYEQLGNPFLRSRGSIFVREDVNYQAPGGANLRGYDPRLSTLGIVAGSLELERALRARPDTKLFNRVAVAAFGDAGHTISDATIIRPTTPVRFLADAGLGLRADHRIGDTRLTTRVDFPLYVSRPELAQDIHPGIDEKFGFRWLFSFGAAF